VAAGGRAMAFYARLAVINIKIEQKKRLDETWVVRAARMYSPGVLLVVDENLIR
jgi:hypothetical protein